jgi:P4 family phage/plasmid primase-like protien
LSDQIREEKKSEDDKLKHFEVSQQILKEMDLATIQETQEILEYQHGVYRKGAIFKIKKRINEIMDDDCSSYFRKEVLEDIRVKTNHSINEFDSDLDILNLRNGLLNVKQGELKSHSPQYFSVNQLNISHDPIAKPKKFHRFLEEILPDVDNRLLVLDMIAVCIWKTTRLKKSFMLVGSGDTGKSTLLNVIIRFLGEENVSNVALQDLENNRFQTSNLVAKWANIYADIDKRELSQSRRFKTVTGGDRITVEKKSVQSYETYLYAKLIFSANQIPETQDESDAFFNRWIIIPFDVQIPTDKQDKELFEKLTTEKELSGILNILLKRLRWIIKAGTIPNAPTAEETREIWLGRSDFARMFLNETIKLDIEGIIGRGEFYSSYIRWCQDKKITPKTDTSFNRKVETFGAIKASTRVEGEPKKVWKGISLKSKQENIPMPLLDQGRKKWELREQYNSVTKATSFSNSRRKQEEALKSFSCLMKQVESGKFPCPDCNKEFETPESLNSHFAIVDNHTRSKSKI